MQIKIRIDNKYYVGLNGKTSSWVDAAVFNVNDVLDAISTAKNFSDSALIEDAYTGEVLYRFKTEKSLRYYD